MVRPAPRPAGCGCAGPAPAVHRLSSIRHKPHTWRPFTTRARPVASKTPQTSHCRTSCGASPIDGGDTFGPPFIGRVACGRNGARPGERVSLDLDG